VLSYTSSAPEPARSFDVAKRRYYASADSEMDKPMSDTYDWTRAEHRCARLPTPGVMVVRAEYAGGLKNWAWCLHVARAATEADLEESHHLEEIGETIWSVAVGISHCPFCGSELEDAADRTSGPSSEFLLGDHRRWTSEYL
jgi:hypothetical protein